MKDFNLKGIKHISKPTIYTWQYIENLFKNIIRAYSYDEIKLSLLEKSILFNKTLGECSDIIKKEMFSFKDNKNRELTLLPEGTTSCLKSLILDGSLRNNSIKNIWYISPMFRKENIQKGRNRLFYQIGIESFGEKSCKIDIEHIIIISKVFKMLNVNDVILEVNYIDNTENSNYKDLLKMFILNNVKDLTTINNERLKINPLMVLDKLNKKLMKNIPSPIIYLKKFKKYLFINILYNLKKLYIPFVVNKFLVRGLNYYTDLVYEWTSKLENRNLTFCAGGRYNDLSKSFNEEKIYATGCALGINRVMLKIKNSIINKTHVLILFDNKIPMYFIIKFSEHLRIKFNNLNLINGIKNLSIKQQIKKAKKKCINLFILITLESLKNKTVIINYKDKYKKKLYLDELENYIWKKNLNL